MVVSLKEENNSWQLLVEDDGIGMSEHTLTGPLIEFGKSFWTSQEAQDEFAGLLSANLRQAGRYGIGFFSTLIIAQRIEVTSRRWDAAQVEARKLTFREGLRLRPLISKTSGTSLGQFCTRVALHITSEGAERLLMVRPREGNLKVTLKELVAHLCLSLDCDVYTSECQGARELAHSRKWYESDALQWARQIAFAGPRADETTEAYLAAIAPLIRVITGPDGEPSGRAAIASGQIEAGIDSVGGLVSARHSRAISNFSMAYIGGIEFEPSGPRRDSGSLHDPAGVKAWASEQAQLLSETKFNELEKYLGAMNVAEFGGDPTPIAMILIKRNPATLASVYDTLAKGENIFCVFGASTGRGPALSIIQHRTSPHSGLAFGWNELEFSTTVMEAWSGRRFPDQVYHQIPTTEEPAPSCFLSCLERYSTSRGRVLNMERVDDVLLAIYKGEASSREKLAVGAELRGAAIKLWLR